MLSETILLIIDSYYAYRATDALAAAADWKPNIAEPDVKAFGYEWTSISAPAA